MTNPNPVAPKTDTPALQELPPPNAEECFGRLREIITDMSEGIEAYGRACDADRMDATFYLSALDSTLAAERASLAAMTEDRDLWKGEHDGDCPNKAALESERASRVQAEEALRELDALWDFSEPITPMTAITYYDPSAINAAMAKARTLLSKPSVSPEQAEETK